MTKATASTVVVTTLHLEPELHSRMKAACRQHDWSVRAFMRRALREKLAMMDAADV
jgi:hypothetical protein